MKTSARQIPALARAATFLAALISVLAAHALGRAPETVAARPDIVVIQTDDQTVGMLRSHFVGPNGGRHLTMPRTLRLIGDRGVEFTNYYTSTPVCSPSRSALLQVSTDTTAACSETAGGSVAPGDLPGVRPGTATSRWLCVARGIALPISVAS